VLANRHMTSTAEVDVEDDGDDQLHEFVTDEGLVVVVCVQLKVFTRCLYSLLREREW
jgi:hypothetical protein